MRPRHPALIVLGLACACHGEGAAFTTSTSMSGGPTSIGSTTEVTTTTADGGDSTSTTTSATTSAASTSEVSTGEVSTSEATSTTFVHDVGSDKDVGTGTPEGCKGKIDFLFVISRYGTMDVIQAQLIDAFPKFISTITSKFADFDYHIMVVDTDAYWGVPWNCTAVCPDLSCKRGDPCCIDNTPKGEPCCGVPDYPCGDLDLVTACDETLGAGTVFNAGGKAPNEPCKVDSGRRYLTKGQSNLSDTFACIAQVGKSGGNEVGAALAAAVAPAINAPGGCNDGFLRDDALLMVTMVTPPYDQSFSGSVEEWYEAVVAAKHDDPEAIVMLLIGSPVGGGDNLQCNVATMFPYHYLEDALIEDYGPTFGAATSLVEKACEALVPG
ncbi:MAG: hypothetical protein R3B09_31215 [Nannocystaceae bacterium]